LFSANYTARQTAVLCAVLSGGVFSGRKYSSMYCSAVRRAVRTALFGAKKQQQRLQCGVPCCQKASSGHKNTVAQIALLYGLL
jgi:hypothetical protein